MYVIVPNKIHEKLTTGKKFPKLGAKTVTDWQSIALPVCIKKVAKQLTFYENISDRSPTITSPMRLAIKP